MHLMTSYICLAGSYPPFSLRMKFKFFIPDSYNFRQGFQKLDAQTAVTMWPLGMPSPTTFAFCACFILFALLGAGGKWHYEDLAGVHIFMNKRTERSSFAYFWQKQHASNRMQAAQPTSEINNIIARRLISSNSLAPKPFYRIKQICNFSWKFQI